MSFLPKAFLRRPLTLAAAVALAGCAFVPGTYPRLEETRAAAAEASADPKVSRYAAAELRRAGEALEQARVARDALDDPAVVDHLAYVARQRVAIAREAAALKAIEPAAHQLPKQ
jgi:uncharacterized protein DUF4398